MIKRKSVTTTHYALQEYTGSKAGSVYCIIEVTVVDGVHTELRDLDMDDFSARTPNELRQKLHLIATDTAKYGTMATAVDRDSDWTWTKE